MVRTLSKYAPCWATRGLNVETLESVMDKENNPNLDKLMLLEPLSSYTIKKDVAKS